MIRTLENDQLRVQINDLGAELTEIYDKTNVIFHFFRDGYAILV